MARQLLTVEVEAKLTVSEETAKACAKMLDIFCENQRGANNIALGRETCEGCVLCEDGYCTLRKAPMYVVNTGKETPKKIRYCDGYYSCPTCGFVPESWEAYGECPECGQALNWEA